MYYGVSTEYMRGLVDYWLTEFDWRGAEAEINEYAQFRTVIDGQPVHFVHEKGKGPDPLPLIVSHGWPWTFWDMRHIIGPLTDPAAHGGDPADSFDVIVPSLAGWGFSTPARGDMNYWKMADIFHTLMTKGLGHERYAASGGDYGSLVTGQLAHKYAKDLAGIHLTMDVPLDLFAGGRVLVDRIHTAGCRRRPEAGFRQLLHDLFRARRRPHARRSAARTGAQRLPRRNARLDTRALA